MKYRDVVAHEIIVALLRVEFHGEAAHVTGQVAGSGAAGDRGKACEDRRLLSRFEKFGAGHLGQGAVGFKETVRARAAGVDDPLGNPLVIEVRDFLSQDEVLQEGRAADTRFQGVLIVLEHDALVGRQTGRGRRDLLVRFAAKKPTERCHGTGPFFRHGRGL